MAQVREVTLEEAIQHLPPIAELRPEDVRGSKRDAVFICALGFEDRSLSMPRMLADSGYTAERVIVLEYDTNRDDNEKNRPALEACLRRISSHESARVPVQSNDYPEQLDRVLRDALGRSAGAAQPSVTLDISACCSRGIIEGLCLLFGYQLTLRIAYSEAAVYHPTEEEFRARPDDWLTEEGAGLAHGVVSIWESSVHPGCNPDHLPNLLVAFPTFKPERTQKLISSGEAQIAQSVWIVGVPRLDENRWRVGAMRSINGLSAGVECYEVSTFEYLDCLRRLEQLCHKYGRTHHPLVSPLGSKLQDVAVGLFLQLRRDVSVWFSVPERFNPKLYTEGTRALWRIDLGDVQTAISGLRSYQTLQVV